MSKFNAIKNFFKKDDTSLHMATKNDDVNFDEELKGFEGIETMPANEVFTTENFDDSDYPKPASWSELDLIDLRDDEPIPYEQEKKDNINKVNQKLSAKKSSRRGLK